MDINIYKENTINELGLKEDIQALESELYQSELYKEIQTKKKLLNEYQKLTEEWKQ